MAPEPLEVVRIAASDTRRRILRLVAQGFDHPQDLAKKLKVRRQSVDKQLVELFEWGFVDRSAVFPPQGRPRIVYRITARGKHLLDVLETVSEEYGLGMREEFNEELQALEDKLAAGDIAEEVYLKRRKDLEARYRRFLP